jgi:hypothetical protein
MRLYGAFVVFGLVACKGPQHPHVAAAGSSTTEVGRAGFGLRAVSASRAVALSSTSESIVTVPHGEWRGAGSVSALVDVGAVHALAVQRSGGELRGEPGSVLISIDDTGAEHWHLAIDATEWVLVTSMAALGDDVIVGGSFDGTLRIADKVVSSAGGSDGFVARISSTGKIVWLVRLGGAQADAVQGVATRKDRIAIAGTFTGAADILGEPLKAYDDRLPYADAFVAELDGNGARRWQQSLGGKGDESVAGVAIDARGNVAIAGSTREVLYVGSQHLVTGGESDGYVAWFGGNGEQGAAMLIGGLDTDGLRAITAVDDRVVVGGFFSGQIKLGDRTFTADGASGGGDDAFFVALEPQGLVGDSWHIGGEGREDVVSLASIPGGFVAGISHTASAKLDDETLPAPADPLSGAAVITHGL